MYMKRSDIEIDVHIKSEKIGLNSSFSYPYSTFYCYPTSKLKHPHRMFYKII